MYSRFFRNTIFICMMKKILFLLLLFISNLSHGQILKLYNGLSISSNKNELDLLSSDYCGYYGAIGVDYWSHDNYYLSSQLGYLGKGGKDHIFIVGPDTDYDFKMKWDYIHLNTTFRLKTRSDNFYPYLGVGPKIDILASSKHILTKEGYDLKLKPVTVGGIVELGIIKRFNKIDMGINASYAFNFNEAGNFKNGNLNNYSNEIWTNTFLVTFSLGYVMGK